MLGARADSHNDRIKMGHSSSTHVESLVEKISMAHDSLFSLEVCVGDWVLFWPTCLICLIISYMRT
jgi:hypothetical protein